MSVLVNEKTRLIVTVHRPRKALSRAADESSAHKLGRRHPVAKGGVSIVLNGRSRRADCRATAATHPYFVRYSLDIAGVKSPSRPEYLGR